MQTNRKQRLNLINWCALLFCALVFATGGTLFALAAIMLASVSTFLSLFSIAMSAGLLVSAGLAGHTMERFA